LTLEGLNRAATTVNSIGEDLQMEYRMTKACVQPGTDFYEGVRAAVIDKDQSPKWNPSNVEEVTVDVIDSYFAPSSDGEEWQIPEIFQLPTGDGLKETDDRQTPDSVYEVCA
jgi:hypothetical protein